MSTHTDHIGYLFTAELQFRLASAVRVATTREAQPLDLPVTWAHGDQSVEYEEIALRPDQADYAACFLQRSATYLMAVAVKDAIKAVIADPKHSADQVIRSAFEIARLNVEVRNAIVAILRPGRLRYSCVQCFRTNANTSLNHVALPM